MLLEILLFLFPSTLLDWHGVLRLTILLLRVLFGHLLGLLYLSLFDNFFNRWRRATEEVADKERSCLHLCLLLCLLDDLLSLFPPLLVFHHVLPVVLTLEVG